MTVSDKFFRINAGFEVNFFVHGQGANAGKNLANRTTMKWVLSLLQEVDEDAGITGDEIETVLATGTCTYIGTVVTDGITTYQYLALVTKPLAGLMTDNRIHAVDLDDDSLIDVIEIGKRVKRIAQYY